MEYIIVVLAFIIIGIIVSFVFTKILKIRVFGGWVMMFIISTIGALLGSYYLPRLSNIQYVRINLSSAILGGIILVILLYIFTPKSLK